MFTRRSRAPYDRYLYWSGRRIESIASDNRIDLEGYRHVVLKSPSVPGVPLPQVELGSKERRTRNRAAVAAKVERALAPHTTTDFDSESPAALASGSGDRMVFAEFIAPYADNPAVVMHTRLHSAGGRQVDVCLFGSLDNVREYQRTDAVAAGWSSSSAHAVMKMLQARAYIESGWWDNPRQCALEALKICLHQGITGHHRQHEEAVTRGYTFGHADDHCQWLAEVFLDITVDLDPRDARYYQGAQRILIGAPLWVRARQVTRYRDRDRVPPRGAGRTQAEPAPGSVIVSGDTGEIPPRDPRGQHT
jgi:hypothetical protein